METFDASQLKRLAHLEARPVVSICMPTHHKGHEVLEGRDRRVFKNHLQELKEELVAVGFAERETAAWTQPLYDLLDDATFWRHQQRGLAVYAAPGFFAYYRVPIALTEHRQISQQCYVKPLLPLLSAASHRFFLLKLAKHSVSLYHATPYEVEEIAGEEALFSDIEEVLKFYQFHEDLQARTNATSVGGIANYFGNSEEDKEKSHLLDEYFRKVDESVIKHIGHQDVPLVLASVEYMQPIYREATVYPHLADIMLTGNFDETRPEELRDRAAVQLDDHFRKRERARVAEFSDLVATDRVSIDPEQILKAAAEGRVKTLLVTRDAHVWGKFEADTLQVTTHQTPQPLDNDLTNQAAVMTLHQGGELFVQDEVRPEGLHEAVPMAAVFRY